MYFVQGLSLDALVILGWYTKVNSKLELNKYKKKYMNN